MALKSYKEIALKRHKFYHGKISVNLKCPVVSYKDFAIWYTPGVADPCREIYADQEKVFEYTNKANFIAVVTDGSRVLGLGDIGPKAGMPVMEGKSLLFKYLGDVDAFPICLDTKDPDEIIQATKWIAPTFGGINLEDIDAPKCFYVFERLSKELEIPVFHDDQQGTAIVTLAGLINALKFVGKKIGQVQIAQLGAGAAGIAVARLLIAAGVKPGNIIMSDSKGILVEGREGLDPYKAEIAKISNKERRTGGIAESIKGSDVVIGLSKPGPGVITEEMVKSMASKSIVFAMANPEPEIVPDVAKKAGAKIVATGRSDYPNQVNNSIGFPAIFRGMLDVRAKAINTQMMLAAAYEIAKCTEEKGLRENYIIPTMAETEVYSREAAAVAKAAIDSGVARIKISFEEERENAERRISQYKKLVESLMKQGFIKPYPA